MKKTLFVLILTLVLPMVAWSQTYVLPIDGDYDVTYYVGDVEPEPDMQGRRWTELDYDDSNWNHFNGVLNADFFSSTGYYIRRTFVLNEVEDMNYYIDVPNSVDWDDWSFFVNGHYSASSGHGRTCLPIPSSILKNGNNVIAIKQLGIGVWPVQFKYGIFKDTNHWGLDRTCYPTIMTDVTDIPNAIYAEPIEYTYDTQDDGGYFINMPIKMKNSNNVANYQFTIQIPDGLGYDEVTLIDDRHDGHSLSYNENNFVVMSLDGGEVSDNDGDIINIKLRFRWPYIGIAGIYPLCITNAVYTMSDGRRIGMPTVWVPITVKYPESGDANNDKEVDVADVITIVNQIVGKPNDKYHERAADANNDGYIDISDAQIVLNRVLGRNARQIDSNLFDE